MSLNLYVGKVSSFRAPGPEKKRRRAKVIAFVVFLLVAAGVALATALYLHQTKMAADEARYERVSRQATILKGQRKYDEARTLLKSYSDEALSKQRKGYAIIQQGALFELDKDYSLAQKTYAEAREVLAPNQEPAIEMGIARSAEALGDKAAAIAAYRRGAELLRAKGNPDANHEAVVLERNIKRLEEGK